ncbi:MAG: DUF1499 domain-containing protein [Alphaproteobacteria bacterium]|nr:DUF1499 domain-containing protein [Alphaproteobacteria bacterium]
MKMLISIVSCVAILLAAALAAMGPGYRFGLWDLGTAFSVMRMLSLPLIVAAALAGAGFLLALWRARGVALFALIAFAAAGAAAYVPIKMKAMVDSNPFIHDVTTDFDDPPQIIAAANEERSNPAAYEGAAIVKQTGKTVEESQKQAFPDIVPLDSSADLKTAAKAAREVVEAMGMRILAEGPATDDAGSGWRIEAVATSAWFGFKDDFIVRIRPQATGGVRVDVRSESRVGGSDLGQNAKRVRAFLKALDLKI